MLEKRTRVGGRGERTRLGITRESRWWERETGSCGR